MVNTYYDALFSGIPLSVYIIEVVYVYLLRFGELAGYSFVVHKQWVTFGYASLEVVKGPENALL